MYLEEITDVPILENATFECKAMLNKEDASSYLKTIAGFANAAGGTFFIGVEDKTYKLIGFTRREADNVQNELNNALNEHLSPRPRVKITPLPYEIHDKIRLIIRVDVPESEVKPVILKYKGVPAIYIRREGYTNGATYEEIIEMSIKSKQTQYDVLPSDKVYEEAHFSKLRDFYAKHNNGKTLSEKALASMGFYDEDKLLSCGATLFEDDYAEGKTTVLCGVYSGFTKGDDRIVTINRYSGDIISTIDYMTEFVTQRMNHSMIKNEDGRTNIDAYPHRALFEGIINAVAHRDYFLDGSQIEVNLFKDRLEILSPGGFYRGGLLGKTYDLSGIISKRRNELISSVLVLCNVMEAAGTGFDKIMEEYAHADDAHKPYICSSSDHFTLVLPDMTYDQGVVTDGFPEVLYTPVLHGTEHDEKVLSFCYKTPRKVGEIAAFLGLSDSSYLRQKILGNLASQKYLITIKKSNTTYYRSNPEFVEQR